MMVPTPVDPRPRQWGRTSPVVSGRGTAGEHSLYIFFPGAGNLAMSAPPFSHKHTHANQEFGTEHMRPLHPCPVPFMSRSIPMPGRMRGPG